jgi:hypothetical protein
MKNLFQLLLVASILVFGSTISASAQSNCYEEYVKVFQERGAGPVPDGIHEVVVTVREGNKSDCYMGKAEVKNNQIVQTLGVILEDGTVKKMGVKLNAKYNDANNPAILYMDIVNGMSSAFLSDDNKLMNIFFYKQLNTKAKSIKLAPPAGSL